MSIQKIRLLELIEFSQQSALLRSKPATSVKAHGLFSLYEHEIQGLPGVRLNVNGPESEDEIWLVVERLHETKPPDVDSAILRPWIQIGSTPTEKPKLLTATTGSAIAAGTQCTSTQPKGQSKLAFDSDDSEKEIMLSDYKDATLVKALFNDYLDTKWYPWSENEKCIRKTIRLYAQLFTLKQQLEGSLVDAPIEFIWGVGLGIWKSNGTDGSYPLIGRLVEMKIKEETSAVEIRPRDVDARIELDWYASVNNPGVAALGKAAKDFFMKPDMTFTPFDRGTFEPILRMAVTNLDANGIYWPEEVPAENRTLPEPEDKLKVTDTWVLFARPRTNNLFLQDLEKLKKQVDGTEFYPSAVAAIVTNPDTTNPIVERPPFRGVSGSYQSESSTSSKKVQELYFPMAYNEEQLRIVQLLEISDGVVVQGPPGTGKTHTIANIICHYLANGKRVLVTSMKDPALAVLHKIIPEEIRPLAISLLSSEQGGMKQFEYAINKIASEVQSLDRLSTATTINHLEKSIDAAHGKLASIDRKIGDWAKSNLAKIILETEEIAPHVAAREVVENAGQFEWITDSLGISAEFAPQFSDKEVMQLREARRILLQDIDYLDSSLPRLVEFPDSKKMLKVHQYLSQFEKLKQGIENGDVPALADSGQEIIALAQQVLLLIESLNHLRDQIIQAHRPWTIAMRERLRGSGNDNIVTMLESLGTELAQAVEWHNAFLVRPVTTPAGMELNAQLVGAVQNLSEGKKPFGWKGLAKSAQKKQLAAVCILGNPPINDESWKHVFKHLALLKKLRELALRWNALARELQLKGVTGESPEGGLEAAHEYFLYRKVKEIVKTEYELCTKASQVFPSWVHARDVADNEQRLNDLQKALRHHLTKNRLAIVWGAKEHFLKVLEGRSGRVIDALRQFLSKALGNPEIKDAQMQSEWTELMAELSRVLGLGIHLAVVRQVCDKIEASGAPKYATSLKQPIEGTADGLLPGNWRKAWRLRRLGTYLNSIDAQDELKKMAKARREVEDDLSHAYRDVVVNRTWLKLAENASPSIRAALQAYRIAVRRIDKDKGTGKSAVYYRQDARSAASQANPAVPCWIMPHYRVSESLPAELGCFDLVIIDEASQSDLTALPCLLRAQKVLIVGDEKQVSPEGIGLTVATFRSLMNRHLGNQVEIYRQQMAPTNSIYDLFKVVFANSQVMLKEHFRCVSPIIEYSKREFYNHELRPLRIPKASERLDPPLIDVLVEHGNRRGKENPPEARFIVDEIKKIVDDPNMGGRSIGVVSLLADKQALLIWKLLTNELGPEIMQRHRITCGDARTFQGKERDIMFLSMVSAPKDVHAIGDPARFRQRFNVAASRAKDRMYLVRSVELGDLSPNDLLRRSLIAHFTTPFVQDEIRVEDQRKLCESPFEREMYDELTQRGFWVIPQVRVGHYRIDMVVEGHNDARLAIECDGDQYHGEDRWANDMQRQRVLERAGWVFWRCFASAFIRRRKEILDDLLKTLAERGIEPIGAEGAPRSVHTELRVIPFPDSGDPEPEQVTKPVGRARTTSRPLTQTGLFEKNRYEIKVEVLK